VPLLLIIILLAAWALLLIRLASPWYGVQDSYRVWVASAVRNYSIYDFEQIGFMVTRNSGPVSPEDLYFYSHHPPLIAWVPALVTELVGFHELGVRYGFICVTLIGIAALYVLARRLFGQHVALWTVFFYAFTPFVAYHGRVPGHDPLGMTTALLFGLVMLNWLNAPTRVRLLGLLVLGWLAVWTAWPAVFLVGGLGFAGFILGNRAQRIAMVGIGTFTVLAFAALMIFYQFQWAGSIDSILEAFVWRSSNASLYANSEPFTLTQYMAVALRYLLVSSAPSIVILALFGGVQLSKARARRPRLIVGMLFILGLAYQLVFRNASYLHDYYWTFLMPALTMCAALAVVRVHMMASPPRFVRPLVDGMILAVVLGTAYTLSIMHGVAQQPMLDAIITGIKQQVPAEDRLLVYIEARGYDASTGHGRVVEFYTFRALDWDVVPSEALAIVEQSAVPVSYIHCDWTIPETLRMMPRYSIWGEYCSLFRFETVTATEPNHAREKSP
jgi:4-amino-4-deoxy-L-arabinose transferase-like glycosyltransferase